MVQHQGHRVVEFALRYFERAVSVQLALQGVLDSIKAGLPAVAVSSPPSRAPPRHPAAPKVTQAPPADKSTASVFGAESDDHPEYCTLGSQSLAIASNLFELLDTNHDGVLDLEELTAVHGGDAQGLFDQMNTNCDGEVDRSEYLLFFSKLERAKGMNAVVLLMKYLLRQQSSH